MKQIHWITSLAVAAALFTSGIVNAIDRLDPDGDFSNLSQQLIVRYTDARSRDMAVEARSLSARGGQNLQFVRSMAVARQHVFRLDQGVSGQALGALRNALARSPDIELVEVDLIMQPHYEPNDTFYPNQWHYYESVGGINLPAAWQKSRGAGVIVAVLDTGSTNHTDLASNYVAGGYDFIHDPMVGNDEDGRDPDASDPGDWLVRWECGFRNPSRPVSSSWHGTHVAGTIAAVTDNNTGVAGVAFDAQILPVRVLGKCGGYTSDIADAIIWASGGTVDGITNPTPAQVINMSLGGSGACGSTMQTAIDMAHAAGTTVVTSAGNSGANASGYSPASCDNVITVAANDRQGNRASYSNYGDVDVTAPGGETSQVPENGVASTLNDGQTTPGGDTYVYYQGTSMAAPHVAGAAALLYAANPSITPTEVKAALEASARPMPGSCSGGCGAGIIDASAAIDIASGGPVNQRPTAAFTFNANQLTVTFTDTSSDPDPGDAIATWDWDFGDGNSSNSQHPTHTYNANGTYKVILTVSDTGAATGTTEQDVIVDGGGEPTTIQLSTSGYKEKGFHRVNLTWSGASGDNVEIDRNGTRITTTSNDGDQLDMINSRGAATYDYKICQEGTNICSNTSTVNF